MSSNCAGEFLRRQPPEPTRCIRDCDSAAKLFLPQGADNLHGFDAGELRRKTGQSPVRLVVARLAFDQLCKATGLAEREVQATTSGWTSSTG